MNEIAFRINNIIENSAGKKISNPNILKQLGFTEKQAHNIINKKNKYKISLDDAVNYELTKDKKYLHISKDKITDKDLVRQLGFTEKQAHNIINKKNKYKISLDDAILYERTRDRQLLPIYGNRLKDLCIINNIDYGNMLNFIKRYKRKHKIKKTDITDSQWIDLFINGANEIKSLRQLCIEHGLSYKSVINFVKIKKLHSLCNTDIINTYIQRDISFRAKCEFFKINYRSALRYRSNHTDLSDNQVINHFRPDLCINIFGELIDPKN